MTTKLKELKKGDSFRFLTHFEISQGKRINFNYKILKKWNTKGRKGALK